MYKVQNLSKVIDNREILKNLDFTITTGKVSTIIGPSGSGKTTLIKCLGGIETPTSGKLIVKEIVHNFSGGKKTTKHKLNYPDVSIVFQGSFLWPHMTIFENISFPLRENGLLDIGLLNALIDRFKIGHIMNKYPRQCSGGEKQRVALIRQVLLRPKFLLLDEVTSALDIEHIKTVIDVIHEIKPTMGIVVVTHLINFAKRVSDEIHFIDDGRIIESGCPSILDNPKTDRLKRFLSFH